MGAKRPKSLVKLNLEPWLSLEEEICLPPKLSPPPASAVHAYPYTPPKPENRIIAILVISAVHAHLFLRYSLKIA